MSVSDARRRGAVLRLLRDGLGQGMFRKENARIRDLARPLASVRDANALIQALDKLAHADSFLINGFWLRPKRPREA